LCWVFLLTFAACTPARNGEVLVAAASDLAVAIREISSTFEKNSGHTVRLTLGSSGNFHTQIANGAPYDVFLSADVAYIRELEKADLIEPGSATMYAIGRIVLWTPADSPIALEQGMKALLDSRARRIAIANPEHAPYGRAAVAAMMSAGVYEAARTRFVLGESISQTAQFVQSGAADIGVVALSLAIAEPMKSEGRYWEIPQESYPRIEQGAAILKQARKAGHLAAAQAFLDAVRSAEGQAVLRRYGFAIPADAPGN
jgi:molybdate transport system substrate-binding protein